MGIGSIIFIVLFFGAMGFFGFNVKKVIANINLGRDKKINDRKGERWMQHKTDGVRMMEVE